MDLATRALKLAELSEEASAAFAEIEAVKANVMGFTAPTMVWRKG